MKIKDLPENDKLDHVRIKLPDDALEKFRGYAGGEQIMYVVGNVNGYGFMMSPDSLGSETRRLYPLPPEILPIDILEWDVA